MSLWSLGESGGFRGNELETRNITCPFCLERGIFSREHHAEKKKPNSDKLLNFDTLKCENCSGYVLVLWAAQEYGGRFGRHDFVAIPKPRRLISYPEVFPHEVGERWLQAKRSIDGENWDAAALMARSSLQLALRDVGAGEEHGTLQRRLNTSLAKGYCRQL